MKSDRVPLVTRAETVGLVWPSKGVSPVSAGVQPYWTQFELNRAWFDRVQRAAGWQVSDDQWTELMTELRPDSMVFALDGKEPVAVACARIRECGWRELAWVAVASEHRGKRLGQLVCSTLIQQLLADDENLIFCSTLDERLAALRIYLKLGFHPVYEQDKINRWRVICANLDWPFTPQSWGWPSTSE